MTEQPRQRRRVSFPLYICCFELLYLLLIFLSPLPGLHLSKTPIPEILPWLLQPSQFLQAALQPVSGNPWFALLLLAIVFMGLIGTYISALLAILRLPVQSAGTKHWLYALTGGTLLFGLTLLLQPMLFFDEVFTYIFSGRILVIYGANPLSVAPIHFPSDAYLHWLVSGLHAPNIYGAFWLYLSALLASISNTPVISLLLFKGLALGTHLINTLIIGAILGKIAPARRLAGTFLYAWNPLALIELAGNGHSEGVLLCLLLLATWLYIAQWTRPATRLPRLAALLIFGLASSTNFITLLVAPLFIWFDLRTEQHMACRLWGTCWRAGLLLLPACLLLWPLWRGADTFLAITSAMDIDHFVHAPVGLLSLPLHLLFQTFAQVTHLPSIVQPSAAADLTLRASTTFLFALIYVNLFAQVRRIIPHEISNVTPAEHTGDLQKEATPDFAPLFESCSMAIFWFLVLVSGWFWPWYVLWLLWIVALCHFDILTSTIVLLSGTALFIYTIVGFSRTPLETYQAALIFGIPLVYLLCMRNKRETLERMIYVYGR